MIESYATVTPAGTPTGTATAPPRERAGSGSDTDAELMARVSAQGDREAFTRLVDRHKDPLVAYLARLTGCSERAQDLAQESFLRLYRAARRYRDQGYFRAYLFRIATNLVRSQERRARRWRKISGILTSASGSGDSSSSGEEPVSEVQGASTAWWLGGERHDADRLTLRRERQRILSRAIAELPLSYRAVLVLSEIEELPHREIAALLGCREGTVKSRLHRARHKLREHLEPYWRGADGLAAARDPR